MNFGQYGKGATEKGIACYKWYDTTLKSLRNAVAAPPKFKDEENLTAKDEGRRAEYNNNLMLIQRMQAFDTATRGASEQDRENACYNLVTSLNSLPRKGKSQVLKAALAAGKKAGGPLTHVGPPMMLIAGIVVGAIVIGAVVFKLRG